MKALFAGATAAIALTSVPSISLAQSTTWTDGELRFEEFSCRNEGITELIIAGTVSVRHATTEDHYSPLDNGKEIKILCDNIRFEEGGEIRADSNLRILVADKLSGPVRIINERGIVGLDGAPIRIADLALHKAPDGTEGPPGRNGKNADDAKGDGTDGEPGGQGNPGQRGANGQPGLEGGGGADAGNIHITTKTVDETTTIFLSARGGEGGAGGRGARGEDGGIGGRGGRGGKGGDGSLLHDPERGGNGGQGGEGGPGGNGGIGGKGGPGGRGGLVFFYISEAGGRLEEAGTYIYAGGDGGYPGIGGPPGLGGDGGPGGYGGGGGLPEDFDPLSVFTLGTHRIVLGDGTEVTWHGEGDYGNKGPEGPKGPDGRAGALGTWGDQGPDGDGGELFAGIVSLGDFTNYSKGLGY